MNYKFIDNKGTFKLDKPDKSSYMYFPLCNEAGLKSSITPTLSGDIKADQNKFALAPVSSEDLHNSNSSRNFWLKINDKDLWSLTGNSALQKTYSDTSNEELTELEAGFLYHKMTRESMLHGLKSTITSFVPNTEHMVEISEFRLENIGEETILVEPTSAVPIYGRSADNYRDHRHVTSLLNVMTTNDHGLSVNPTLSFDERGHLVNEITFGVVGASNKSNIEGFITTQEELIGEGGSLDWPRSLFNRDAAMTAVGEAIDGYETVGSLCFGSYELKAGESMCFYIGIYIDEEANDRTSFDQLLVDTYLGEEQFNKHLELTKEHWQDKVDIIKVDSANHSFDQWMKWINLQPILRRIYGCSFLPHHDYGRGGRGWRDLWQDCLALLLMEPDEVGYLLYNNFAGVRIDGTNATIIGDKPGEFKADRNNISRTWMDHGAWPWLTTKEYIHQSGDIDFLFEEQVYFRDRLTHRSSQIDTDYNVESGQILKDETGKEYRGTILEHLLLQNVSIFYNVGDHNILKLEDADWNDALDMAGEKGESVAFSCLYASNIKEIADLLKDLAKQGVKTLSLAKESLILFESLDYNNIELKHEQLNKYFDGVASGVSGIKEEVAIEDIYNNLEEKYKWFEAHIQSQEFISDDKGNSWFNSYYDNHGNAVEGEFDGGTRMMLTGQVFSLMSGIATPEMSQKVIDASKEYLYDKNLGGYRLNTNFNEVKHDLGRAFGFAYGHKENGAMFSHMAVMYGNALYKQGFINEASDLIFDMFNHCNDFDKARIYPSVPEYINERGRGMYTYLTGSASWLLYTVVSEMYGCKGRYGDLLLEPKLVPSQFKDGKASITFLFNKKPLTVTYILDETSEVSTSSQPLMTIKGVTSAGQDVKFADQGQSCVVIKSLISEVQASDDSSIDVLVKF